MEWRTIPFSPKYEASDTGLVRRKDGGPGTIAGQVRHPVQNRSNGYLYITLPISGVVKSMRVNRIICRVFHGEPPELRLDAAHSDGDRLNNHAENLSWKTRRENNRDKKAHGTEIFGERNNHSVLTEAQVMQMPSLRWEGKTFREIGEHFGVKAEAVSRIFQGKRWAHLKIGGI
jgi:HNH endonuclease/NUMOD4 motif